MPLYYSENLNEVVEVRSWDHDTQKGFWVSVKLIDAIKTPYGLNMADIGFHLMNVTRLELGLETLPYSLLAK